VARDITLFEQRGCLSPHHVFVEDCGAGEARGYAARLARALAVIANEVPTPARPAPEAGAEIRGIRERARWRALAYPAETALWESDDLGWTVIYDRDADFRVSPGWRTVHVSAIGDAREFADRLGGLAGHIEAVALEADADRFAEIAERLMAIGVSRVCAPGTIQSPPVDWRHGGGAFFDLLEALR